MINPCRLLGMWNEGYVMDSHTITSTYLGCDEYGHDRYHTERTELGQLIYEMKYNGHNDTSLKIIDIISKCDPSTQTLFNKYTSSKQSNNYQLSLFDDVSDVGGSSTN